MSLSSFEIGFEFIFNHNSPILRQYSSQTPDSIEIFLFLSGNGKLLRIIFVQLLMKLVHCSLTVVACKFFN